jgi:hypothetical protein
LHSRRRLMKVLPEGKHFSAFGLNTWTIMSVPDFRTQRRVR